MIKHLICFLFKPKKTCDSILLDENFQLKRKHLIFIVFMNIYYIFLPSFLATYHLLTPLVFMLQCGAMFYFAREASALYSNNKGGMETSQDQSFMYKVAYCFALANIPAMIYYAAANIFVFANNQSMTVAFVMAIFANIPGIFIALIYPVKVMGVISRRSHGLMTVIQVWLHSWILSIREMLGIRAIKNIINVLKKT